MANAREIRDRMRSIVPPFSVTGAEQREIVLFVIVAVQQVRFVFCVLNDHFTVGFGLCKLCLCGTSGRVAPGPAFILGDGVFTQGQAGDRHSAVVLDGDTEGQVVGALHFEDKALIFVPVSTFLGDFEGSGLDVEQESGAALL